MLVAEPKARSETIEMLRDALVHMAHSREGAYAALHCVWHGTAKDRKAIIKSFKTFMLKTAQGFLQTIKITTKKTFMDYLFSIEIVKTLFSLFCPLKCIKKLFLHNTRIF